MANGLGENGKPVRSLRRM